MHFNLFQTENSAYTYANFRQTGLMLNGSVSGDFISNLIIDNNDVNSLKKVYENRDNSSHIGEFVVISQAGMVYTDTKNQIWCPETYVLPYAAHKGRKYLVFMADAFIKIFSNDNKTALSILPIESIDNMLYVNLPYGGYLFCEDHIEDDSDNFAFKDLTQTIIKSYLEVDNPYFDPEMQKKYGFYLFTGR